MGPYCNFCTWRCFAYIPDDLPQDMLRKYKQNTLTATCAAGQAFEKKQLGICYGDIKAWRKQQENIARFFAHLFENISILTEEFELDLSAIHTLEFTPHIGGPGWWLDVDEDQFIWIRRDYRGACEVVFNGYRSDYADMYAQAQEVVS